MEVVQEEMQRVCVTEEDVGDRVRWRQMVCCGAGCSRKKKTKKKTVPDIDAAGKCSDV